MTDINILPVEEQDFERLFEIERAAHLVPWSMGTLKNNQGERTATAIQRFPIFIKHAPDS